ncbi:cell envelope biogenesis protein TolA [Xinfangfangia sp. D13-10-4-6]|uniref:cell envelope biogenesis protein TolA n=1 Tax=Pseudogemmobacter hezensis TaxID=2737662 RepID=UPI00155542DF|nr:cell envelope biogenesis protein TolA [Pseudogemmobacter hezensis]NPD14134.1 cell envelope biogenesis protein TolA [Pseudogemmobacter hezensis]
MEGRFKTGTILSGAGHAGLILWVMIGDWFFSPSPPPDEITMTVSTMTAGEFDAMVAAAPQASDTPSDAPDAIAAPDPVEPGLNEPVAEPTPQPDPAPQPEPVAPPPEPEPEPQPTPDPQPAPQDTAPPEAVFAPEEQSIPTMSTSVRPKPRPANIVAPNPTPASESAETAETPQETVAPTPEPTPEPPREEQTATAPQETGDVLRTEATEDTQESLGMQTSPRPKPRPNRPAPTQTPPAETQDQRDARIAAEVAAEDRAQQDRENAARIARERAEREAEAAAIAAAAAAASQSSGPSGTGGQGQAASGPPLNASETGNIAAAIGSKWNVGTMGTGAMSTLIVVRVTFDQSGRPTDMKLIESSGPSQNDIDVAFRTARSAIARAYQEGGIPLPADKYQTWKVLDFVFDANGMRLR